MNILILLETEFFAAIENKVETDIRQHYHEIRDMIVGFAHSGANWRHIHTGLSVFIAEVSSLIEGIENILLSYARRIVEIAKSLLRQIELAIEAGVPEDEAEPVKTKSAFAKRGKLTAKYTDVCELINLIISMKMMSGGKGYAKHIIDSVHEMFALDCDTDKYYKTRGDIAGRSPMDDCRAYFIRDGLKVLNKEYLSA